MVTLYDPRGNKINRAQLKQEQSAPSLRSVRQVYSGSPSQGLSPQRLARIFKQADQGDLRRQCELFEDMEEKDLHLASVIGTRRRAVSGLEIKIDPPDNATAAEKKAADLVRDHVSGMSDFSDSLDGMLDALGKGYSVTEIGWKIHKQSAMIESLDWREPKFFRFDQASQRDLRLLNPAYADGEPLTPYKYIRHIYSGKSGIVPRSGLFRPCAWTYLFKNYALKDWVTFAEVYGQPLRVGKYPASASEEEKDVLLRAVANLGSDAAAIIPESMLIEFIEAGGKQGSADLYEKLARFCDEQMSKGILGQTSSSDAMAGGLGSGQANLHGDVRHDLLRADAKALGGSLSRDLVRPLVDLNLGPLTRYPRLSLWLPHNDDLPQLREHVTQLHGVGLPIGHAFLYDKFNIPAPKAGEAVLAAPLAAPSPPPRPDIIRNAQQTSSKASKIPKTSDAIDLTDTLMPLLEGQASPAMDGMLAQIKALMDEVDSLEALAQRLPELIGDMTPSDFTEVMAKAFASAELAGQYDVSQGQ